MLISRLHFRNELKTLRRSPGNRAYGAHIRPPISWLGRRRQVLLLISFDRHLDHITFLSCNVVIHGTPNSSALQSIL